MQLSLQLDFIQDGFLTHSPSLAHAGQEMFESVHAGAVKKRLKIAKIYITLKTRL